MGTLDGIGALSFYPTKNLGALGDGGAILVSDRGRAEVLRQLRNGGQSDRYRHVRVGVNSRLDELQAAVLRVGLRHLAAWTERRRELARLYLRELEGSPVRLLREQPYARSVYHLFVVRHPRRDALVAGAPGAGGGHARPLPDPPAPAAGLRRERRARRATSRWRKQAAGEVLSLPLYPAADGRPGSSGGRAVRAAAERLA